MAKHVSSTSDFDSTLRSAGEKLVVIDFTASWCGPCKAIAPVFESLAKTHAGKAHFLKVDVDEHQAIAQRYGVRAMPTFAFVRNGGVVDTMRGADANKLQALTQQYIKGGIAASGTFPGAGKTIGGDTVASGASQGSTGFFGLPAESLMPFVIVFGYLAYVMYNNFMK